MCVFRACGWHCDVSTFAVRAREKATKVGPKHVYCVNLERKSSKIDKNKTTTADGVENTFADHILMDKKYQLNALKSYPFHPSRVKCGWNWIVQVKGNAELPQQLSPWTNALLASGEKTKIKPKLGTHLIETIWELTGCCNDANDVVYRSFARHFDPNRLVAAICIYRARVHTPNELCLIPRQLRCTMYRVEQQARAVSGSSSFRSIPTYALSIAFSSHADGAQRCMRVSHERRIAIGELEKLRWVTFAFA